MNRFAFLRCACVAALAVILVSAGPTNAQQSRDNYTPAPLGTLKPVAAKHGMVVAQERLSAQVGADVMARGGNAIDAAVATGFAMAVTYPRAGNIGGGGFMVIHTAKGESTAIDYRETAPGRASRDMFLGSDGKPDIAKSRDSALGIGIPGTVAGLALALEKYGSGKFTLSDLLQPAIALARDGFVLTDDSRYVAGLASPAGALAIEQTDLLTIRWHVAARGRQACAGRPGADADGHRAARTARILRRACG